MEVYRKWTSILATPQHTNSSFFLSFLVSFSFNAHQDQTHQRELRHPRLVFGFFVLLPTFGQLLTAPVSLGEALLRSTGCAANHTDIGPGLLSIPAGVPNLLDTGDIGDEEDVAALAERTLDLDRQAELRF